MTKPPGSLPVLLTCAMLLMTSASRAAEGYREMLVQDGRSLQLDISPEFGTAQRAQLVIWIDFLSHTLAQVYGHWPRQAWQISVSPASAATTDPIPWAQVHRASVDQVEFFTAPHATAETLKHSWTGYHELAHLLIPYRGWGDAWFSEGLASYYQNILQVRSGMLTEQQTWQNLYDGFLRARADSRFEGQPLSAVSDRMRKNGGFMRVYWSGAWYFLTADIRLRRQSGGEKTLDSALKKLNECCADKQLSVVQMVSKLDQLNKVLLFQPLFEQVGASTEMPEFENIFASLGVSVLDGTVALQQEGPGAQLRQQVVKPKQL